MRTGFERAFGGHLRVWLRRSTAHRTTAALSGSLAAILMQSSTAVAVLMAGFVSSGTIGGVSGLAILLGADLGSAIVAQILNSPISVLSPLLLVSGVVIFLQSERRQLRQVGRILVGLSLLFISLDLIRAASQPLVASPSTEAVMIFLAEEPLSAFLVAALFTWVVHSSVAAILLFVTMASQGVMPVEAAFAMVLGANLGGSIIAVVLTLKSGIAVRRAVWANLVLRGGGAAAILYAISVFPQFAAYLGAAPGQQALNLHLAFNAVLVVLGLPLIGLIFRAMTLVLPDAPAAASGTALPSALDPEAQAHPRRAFSCATRELVQIGGHLETMQRNVLGLFERYDEPTAQAIRRDHAEVARMALDLRIYLAGVHGKKDEDEIGTRAFELAGIASNLEAAADMIARKIAGHASRMHHENLKFSEDGWRDLSDLHDAVLRNVQLGISVLMNEDPALARSLVEQKVKIREMAQKLEQRHLYRLKQGLMESIETSGVHLDVLRSLKEVNTSFAMIAYPLLSEAGVLLQSRLASE